MRRLLSLVLLAALAGCGGDPATIPVVSAPSPSEPPMFTNPVFAGDFPDPGVIREKDIWFVFGTNSTSANVPVLTSEDMVTWTALGDALPELGSWAGKGNTWAPEVVAIKDGYLLYYTARSAATGRQCIGVAYSKKPEGPYRDTATEPLVCQADEGGSIDASPYKDKAGKLFLYWKNDGNAIGRTTYIYAQALSDDGRALVGERVKLLRNDAAWEGQVIEAPQMVENGKKLFMFYSANAFDRPAYAVGYATCESPLGPCAKGPENPILKSSNQAAGPGHSYLVNDRGGQSWLFYHAWAPNSVGSVSPGRQLWLDRVDWPDGRPLVRGPNPAPQPLPDMGEKKKDRPAQSRVAPWLGTATNGVGAVKPWRS